MDEVTSLKEAGYTIQLVEDSQRVFIIFENYPIPADIFNAGQTDLMVWTSKVYPASCFDMFWTLPELTLKNGAIPYAASLKQEMIGRNWRRFSIHPYNHIKWNPAVDSLSKYLVYVEQRLKANR